MTKVYCGLAHSTWGLLLLFASIQLFISLVYFPATITIFQASASIRSALSTNEQKWAAVDSGMTYTISGYQLNSLTSTTGTVYVSFIDPITNQTNSSSYVPASARVAEFEANQAQRQVWDAIYGNTKVLSYASVANPTTFFSPVALATNSPSNTKFDVYLDVNNNVLNLLTTGGRPLVPSYAMYSKAVRTGVDTNSTATSVSNLGIQENAAKQFTTAVSASLFREELFGAFFSFQTLMAMVFFLYVFKCYKNESSPVAGSAIAWLGGIGMFAAYASTFSDYNVVGVNSLITGDWITGSLIGNFIANPYIAILNILWPLNIVYSVYATKAFD
eukprot:TRINITY_DN2959_c0_g1_i1.p1 TRINITY_DN2959_c0_g1~~TRINITY_DN2959_c0_g1_i1.p1  ORF type:complete len:331 (-),score=92.05 TRINITY_DN2959_c0_g1_i1:90-1082(-)